MYFGEYCGLPGLDLGEKRSENRTSGNAVPLLVFKRTTTIIKLLFLTYRILRGKRPYFVATERSMTISTHIWSRSQVRKGAPPCERLGMARRKLQKMGKLLGEIPPDISRDWLFVFRLIIGWDLPPGKYVLLKWCYKVCHLSPHPPSPTHFPPISTAPFLLFGVKTKNTFVSNTTKLRFWTQKNTFVSNTIFIFWRDKK